MYLNVFNNWHYLLKPIYKQTLYTPTLKTLLHSSNMQKQKLHHFCNRSSHDDGPKSSRKY